ncbi:S9 family peptidase [Oceanithermus desulfurans]|uniref:Peptidase S9 n=2 Tax=Oceanithermus desulfurans TaxID=227924 RepID=A0A511RL62_9DEIN|nr:S9 family peptidase [Oceanithermus desulfurans]MBB6029757.1 dipeptidyl aminopeptidase/acylaminoacyl peptidase [Oceanithermus desulfurans]GEM89546.1 peptidase S9 [Oceanithermus desulfurans NBRC 100063]
MPDPNPQDFYRLRFLSDLTPGPGGGALFLETSIEAPEQEGEPPRYRSRLWLQRDGQRRALTQEDTTSPRWDGGRYVYFLRKRDKVKQLFRLDLAGGEAEPLTSFKAGVEGYVLGPEGALAVLTRGDEEPAKPDAPRVFDRLPFKFDGVGLLPERSLQVRVRHPDGEWSAPSELPTDVDAVAWDDRTGELVLVASADFEERRRWIQRLYRWRPGGEAVEIGGGFGPVSDPVFSEDGGWVYFVGYDWAAGIGASPGVWRLPRSGGEAERLTPETLYVGLSLVSDVHYGGYGRALEPDGEGGFWFSVTEAGEGRLYRLRPDGRVEGPLELPGSLAAFAVSEGEVRHTLLEDHHHPPVLYTGDEPVYDPNADLLEGWPRPETFRWCAPEGHDVQGWVLLPAGDGPHPAVLYVHGGPHAAYGRAMLFEFYLLRARGLAVVYANPRGSVGYGQDYAQIKGRWGEADAADLLGFLDAAVDRFGLDAGRLGVAGGSYGGFMTNWLTARHPDKFKAAATQRSICNWTSFWGASDIGIRFAELELGAGLWEDPSRYWQQSPLAHAHALKTPTLVVHAEQDHRCPIDQGETWFAALVSRGVPARFLRVPEEGHELSRSGRPDRRVKRLEEILDWFTQRL